MSWNLLDMSTLRSIDLFYHVSDEALAEIMAVTDTHHVEAGEIIFRQGQTGDALYFILDGEVRISTDVHDVGEEALAFLETGACFGEGSLFSDDATRSAHAIAGTDCHLGMIPRDEFLELMDANPTLATDILWSFVTTLSDRLRETNEKLEFFALNEMYN